MPRWIGPHKVLKRIGNVAYRLDLPLELTMHPVLHLSLLQPRSGDCRVQPPLPCLLMEGDLVRTVDRIPDHHAGKPSYP